MFSEVSVLLMLKTMSITHCLLAAKAGTYISQPLWKGKGIKGIKSKIPNFGHFHLGQRFPFLIPVVFGFDRPNSIPSPVVNCIPTFTMVQ
jgi:hypothetical protein